MIQSWSTLSDFFGFNGHLGINVHWIHELVMFLILTGLAIMDLGKSLLAKVLVENELKAVNERLELGRTVQSMLLPPSMQGEFGRFSFRYYYDPAEKMSGDWLNIWRSERQNHLFLGDVVGKGPQAALAVAAIASVINDSKFHGLTIAQTIERINCQLIDLFQKHITSTFSSVTFHEDGSIELHNAASLGWFALHGNKVQHLPMRSMPLGVVKNAPLATVKRTFEPGTTLFAFTDGVLEGSRALKNLFTKLKAMPDDAELTFDELHEMLLTLGKEHVLVDDKSVLIVKIGEPQTRREFQAG
jgi:serine phosphatase RsbU (regulator of sigma subunit)